ncbi:MAG TPA: CopG family transcriptional regulator [Thermodesulfovibrionales bacterium]|nr:CopG family transcriptional regulator [Thermodesulfovibrionales bacterium]
MRRKVSEKRTQVYFPSEVYRRIVKQARDEDKSSAQIIREAVEKFLEEKSRAFDWQDDPLFHAVGILETEAGDLSENHDAYIYGKEARRGRR